MLIIEDDSVYEIDEECLAHQSVPPECMVYEKLQLKKEKERENTPVHNKRKG